MRIFLKYTMLMVVAMLFAFAFSPHNAQGYLVKDYAGRIRPMTFFSPKSHGQQFATGPSIYIGGSQTIPFCTSRLFNEPFPFGCAGNINYPSGYLTNRDLVNECAVRYSIIQDPEYGLPGYTEEESSDFTNRRGVFSGMLKDLVIPGSWPWERLAVHPIGLYLENFTRNADSVTCDFDRVLPLPPNFQEGKYIVRADTQWGSFVSEIGCGEKGVSAGGYLSSGKYFCGIGLGSVGEHITMKSFGGAAVEGNFPIVMLKADEHLVPYNGSTRLRWRTFNVTSCTASGGWSGSKAVADAQERSEITPALLSKTTFTLTCSGPGGTISKNKTIDVLPPPPPAVDIKANGSDSPPAISQNTAAMLSWTSQRANSCTASGGWSGIKSVSGNESTGNLTSDKVFTITCVNEGGSSSDSVNVPIQKPNLTSSIFNVSGALMAGTATALSGSVTNGSNVNVTATFQNRFEIDRDQNGVVDDSVSASMTAINANQNKPASASWTPTQAAATYRVRLCADTPGNVINESNEGDNCSEWSASFTVQPKPAPPPLPCGGAVCTYGCNTTTNVCNLPPPPLQRPDLIISSSPLMRGAVTLQQLSSAETGQQVYFTFAVKNNGNAATPGGFSNQVFIDLGNNGSIDVTLSPNSLIASSLGALASQALASGVWTAQTGTHRVTACADYPLPGGVSESSEINNCSGQGVSANDVIITISPPPPACSDGRDNDGDGKIDMADPGCANPSDNDEADPPPPLPNSNFTLSASPVLLTATVVGGSSALATTSATFVTITPQAGFTPGSQVTLILDKSVSHAVSQNLVSRFVQSDTIMPEVTITVGSAPQSVVFRLGVPHNTALGTYNPIVIRAKDTDKTVNLTLGAESGGTGER